MSEEKTVFWLDGWEGKAAGGYFIRNGLFQFFDKLKEAGKKPVGIVIDDSWNMEVIVEETNV